MKSVVIRQAPKPSHPVRSIALHVLLSVLKRGEFASEVLDRTFRSHSLKDADRRLLTQLVYGTLREKAYLDWILKKWIRRPKTPAFLYHLIQMGAYQILFLDKVPDYAVVFESVEIAKKKGGTALGKMVNAVLHRVIEFRDPLLQEKKQIWKHSTENASPEILQEIAAQISLPAWLLNRWCSRYSSSQVQAMMEAFQSVPPIYLRLNRLSSSAVDVSLFKKISDTPMVVASSKDLEAIQKLLKTGGASMQDLGSYRVVEQLSPKPDEIGLDACAGHGGKASAIAEFTGNPPGHLFVHEPNPAKCKELELNFSRLGLGLPTWFKPPRVSKKPLFDWILIDAPCSGLGTLGRKPEIRWRVQESDIFRCAKTQAQILESWCDFLKPGGRLVYSVCSLEPEEGPELLKDFVHRHPELTLETQKSFLPFENHCDGFFVATLRREPACTKKR